MNDLETSNIKRRKRLSDIRRTSGEDLKKDYGPETVNDTIIMYTREKIKPFSYVN